MSPRLRWLCAGLALAATLLVSRLDVLVLLGLCALPRVLRRPAGRRALRKRMSALVPLMAAVVLSGLIGGTAVFYQRTGLLLTRVMGAGSWLTWATYDLTALQLEAALLAARVPEGFVELLFATRRFGQQLTATLQAAWAALALRGGLLSVRALVQTVGAVAGVVVVRSLDRSERIASASALRGGELRSHPNDQDHEGSQP